VLDNILKLPESKEIVLENKQVVTETKADKDNINKNLEINQINKAEGKPHGYHSPHNECSMNVPKEEEEKQDNSSGDEIHNNTENNKIDN
jgi:hypothetical protein